MLRKPVITEDDYLAGEVTAALRYELVSGQIYAMAGACNSCNRCQGEMGVSSTFAQFALLPVGGFGARVGAMPCALA